MSTKMNASHLLTAGISNITGYANLKLIIMVCLLPP